MSPEPNNYLLPKIRGFKMACLNIVSIPGHIDELRILLNDQLPDIVALNETRLGPTISSDEMQISGYDLIRCDRNRNGGGAAIYLRSTLNYINRSDLVPQALEAVCLEIVKPNSKPFLVVTIYRPPESPADHFDILEEFIASIDNLDKEFHVLRWRRS